MVVLQTILLVIIVYYVLKILWKWLLPRILNYAVKKTAQHVEGSFQSNDFKRKKNYSKFQKKQQPKSNPTKKVGEYIEFEEIE